MDKIKMKEELEKEIKGRVNRTPVMQYLDLYKRIEEGKKTKEEMLNFDDVHYDRSKKTIKKELENLEDADIIIFEEGFYKIKKDI